MRVRRVEIAFYFTYGDSGTASQRSSGVVSHMPIKPQMTEVERRSEGFEE